MLLTPVVEASSGMFFPVIQRGGLGRPGGPDQTGTVSYLDTLPILALISIVPGEWISCPSLTGN